MNFMLLNVAFSLFRYESSGYDESSFRKVYHSSPHQKKFSSTTSNPSMMHRVEEHQIQEQQQQQQQQQQQHYQEQHQQEQKNTIESGPSFNESLERFRLATSSGNESDGDFQQQTSSMFRQQQQQHQQQQTSSRTFSSSIQKSNVTRSVEEQRTIITRNSQKSYHIE